jgi:hypothetical protein
MALIQHYRGVLQLGYVTKDLERATSFFEKKIGAAGFSLAEHELTADFRGRQRSFAMRVALARVGDRQIEIIQPLSGAVEFYREGVDFDRSIVSFHHVGLAIEGPLATWDTMVEEVRSSGDEFTLIFASDENPDFRVRFAYVDTRAHYGHFTEYLWWSPGTAFFNQMLPDLANSAREATL